MDIYSSTWSTCFRIWVCWNVQRNSWRKIQNWCCNGPVYELNIYCTQSLPWKPWEILMTRSKDSLSNFVSQLCTSDVYFDNTRDLQLSPMIGPLLFHTYPPYPSCTSTHRYIHVCMCVSLYLYYTGLIYLCVIWTYPNNTPLPLPSLRGHWWSYKSWKTRRFSP